MTEEQRRSIEQLEGALEELSANPPDELLWNAIVQFQGDLFYTAKNLEFFYLVKGNEMFVSRKDKSITRASVMMAFHKALELGRVVKGPKKLGTFGASYLYPVFWRIGVIRAGKRQDL